MITPCYSWPTPKVQYLVYYQVHCTTNCLFGYHHYKAQHQYVFVYTQKRMSIRVRSMVSRERAGLCIHVLV